MQAARASLRVLRLAPRPVLPAPHSPCDQPSVRLGRAADHDAHRWSARRHDPLYRDADEHGVGRDGLGPCPAVNSPRHFSRRTKGQGRAHASCSQAGPIRIIVLNDRYHLPRAPFWSKADAAVDVYGRAGDVGAPVRGQETHQLTHFFRAAITQQGDAGDDAAGSGTIGGV